MADENGMLVTPGTSPLKDVGNHKPSFFRGSVGASSRGSWQEKETKPQDPKKDGVTKVSTQGKNGTGADNNTGTKVESVFSMRIPEGSKSVPFSFGEYLVAEVLKDGKHVGYNLLIATVQSRDNNQPQVVVVSQFLKREIKTLEEAKESAATVISMFGGEVIEGSQVDVSDENAKSQRKMFSKMAGVLFPKEMQTLVEDNNCKSEGNNPCSQLHSRGNDTVDIFKSITQELIVSNAPANNNEVMRKYYSAPVSESTVSSVSNIKPALYKETIDSLLEGTIKGLSEEEKQIFKKLQESNKEGYILGNELKFKWEIDLKSSPAYLNWNAKLGRITVSELSNLGRNYFTGLANQSLNDWNESQNKFISAKIMLDFYKAYEFVKYESAENKVNLHSAFKKSSEELRKGNNFAEENYIKKDSFTQIKEGDRVIGYDLEMLNGVTLHLRYGDIYNVSENSSTRFTSSKIYAISEDGKQVKFTDYIMRVHSGAIDTKIMDEYGALVGVARNMLVAGYLIQEGGKKK